MALDSSTVGKVSMRGPCRTEEKSEPEDEPGDEPDDEPGDVLIESCGKEPSVGKAIPEA